MASFFSRFFGGKPAAPAAPATPISAETEVYNDLFIVATPMKEGGQFRLAGRIERRDGDRTFVRSFIRADLFASRDDTVAATFRKGRQIVDQHGASLFADGTQSRTV
ncbi:HlyU family transcriptional regulator [Rhizobium sp. TRM95111]|uniref:HlyU family transcriptional regulator n=1 Tax=Rhizobium alarense TaxID=2846851 RepID=UPI001F1B4E19|nr:HlyU family transcriptional regulator [Rhizobium alarense]MCF3640069.1 HlyU family transcriptional regulator [Rhizobium alarense]